MNGIGVDAHKTKDILLFRHGETEWNTLGRRQGQMDSPLTARGRLQARENARRLLSNTALDKQVAVFSSPIGRAKDTALIILHELGLPIDMVTYDDRLKESSFGDWEGLTDDEVAARYPASWQARITDRWNVRPSSGEAYCDVHARVLEWYSEAEFTETNLVICHGLVSRVFRGIYAGLSHTEVFDLPEPHDGFYKLSAGTVTYIA